MEIEERKKQFGLTKISGLVTMADQSLRRSGGPSGEVESLLQKKDARELMKEMGSRVSYSKPVEESNKKKKKSDEEFEKKGKVSDGNVLESEIDQMYKPKTRETKIAYEVLLSFVQEEMPGGQPHDVLRSAADEVLAILKDESILKELDRQAEIESLFRRSTPLDSARYASLVNIGKSITDFKSDENVDTAQLDEKTGVAVIFDESEEEDNDEELDQQDDDDGVEKGEESPMEVDDSENREPESKHFVFDIKSVDAFWLQRSLSKYYPDALISQQMADDVFAAMVDPDVDGRKLENKLVSLLQHDKFDLIKILLQNRWPIVYAVRYARSSGTERSELVSEMRGLPALSSIIDIILGNSVVSDISKPVRKNTPVSAASAAVSALRGKIMLDLETLSFAQGGHFMSNQNVNLPTGSFQQDKKGYHEVHVPALKPSEMGHNEKLVEISSLPSWAQPAFAGMKSLNRIQSRIYQTALLSSENVLLCAPTGAGKTNVAMLTILRELGAHRLPDGSIDKTSFKIVYVAPMKSLVREMVDNFTQRLGTAYGLTVRELSGDQQLTKQQINETQIIVTTPEKWDIITRKSGDRVYTQLVKLLIIDEIHLLHDDRGPVLESIISRCVRNIESSQQLTRLVGLSATLPNYEDVATFLRVDPAKGLFFFDNSFRPCPLQQVFVGITEKKPFKRHQMMNEIAYEKVIEQATAQQQVLIFVHTRKDTAATAKAILALAQTNDTLHKILRDDSSSRPILQDQAESSVKSAELKDLMLSGFAIHHAGLTRGDRVLVEDLFGKGHIRVLVSTSTLAWGVNLPAHAVIIKGTQVYNPEKGKWTELSPQDVLQMLGRAGRPQYDNYGEGFIITSKQELYYYLSLLNQQLPIESQFLNKIVDALNAEIVLGSITNVKEAVDWLGYTYLFVRMLRSPKLYGVPEDSFETDRLLVQRRTDIIHTAASLLDKTGLVKYDRKTGIFSVTDLGRVSSHYYITYTSMATYSDYLKPSMSDIELFRVFSLSEEFKYINIREEEKLELAKLLDKVPIPVRESIEEPSAKVNVLLQAYLSRLQLDGFALMSDMVYVTQSAGRIMRCLFEICVKRGWASVAEKALSLCKMIEHRMWGCQSPLRQFNSLPVDVIKRLEMKDFPWERLFDLKPQEIGEFIKVPKLGKPVYTAVHQVPRLELTGHVQPITRTILRVELAITPDFQFDETIHGDAEPFYIFVTDVDGETILHTEYFILKRSFSTEVHNLSFTIPIFDPLPPQYYVRVISDRWMGSETILPIAFRHLLLPEKYPAPTELLDLQPLPVSSFSDSQFFSNYSNFRYFNAIQTQCFTPLYSDDSNILIAAPTGSGKTVCAEFAMLKSLKYHPEGRIVYLSSNQAVCNEKYIDWKKKFGSLGVSVVLLTGDNDLALLKEGKIIIATAEHWDVMSRRWKTRKDIHTVRLVIVDELHLIGSATGHVLEVVVSRMRYMSKELGNTVRIVGLSTSLANAKDLGDWFGVPAKYVFNFHPNTRPVPLELSISGIDNNHYESRMLSMSKPTYAAVSSAGVKPVLIFVPDRSSSRRVAADMLTFAAAEDAEKRFLHLSEADISEYLVSLNIKHNVALCEMLSRGVGYLHDGLSENEKSAVKHLFKAGAIQICVVEQTLCWGLDLSSFLVIIMGTQRYDGREHRYMEYPLPDVLQMIGKACRPQLDDHSKALVFCHTPRKEFLKKFLYEPIPVESHLDHFLADHMAAEVVSKRIENVQEAVDYLTWSFLYRRLTQNPNYYNLQGVSHRHLSDYLSELVETTLQELVGSKCISIDNDADPAQVSALNLGMIASYYYIKYKTVELFSQTLSAKSKLRSLLEVLCHSSEFELLPVRRHEEVALQSLARHLPLKISDPKYNDPLTKANVLLQAHFCRLPLTADVQGDLNSILPDAARLLQAMVDVISSSGWLTPALAAMEMSQMVTQGMWNTDSPLLQLPHFTPELVDACKASSVDSIFDLMDMEDSDRNSLLGKVATVPSKMADIARFCNQYPTIELSYELEGDKHVVGESVTVNVQLSRDLEDDEIAAAQKVSAARYPKVKMEGWWLVLGDVSTNQLLSIKRIVLNKQSTNVSLDFEPSAPGDMKLVLYLMCDSYMGCDQEHKVNLKISGAVVDKMEE